MASIPRPRLADGSADGNRCAAARLNWSGPACQREGADTADSNGSLDPSSWMVITDTSRHCSTPSPPGCEPGTGSFQ
jgi:hypothetical protein